MTNIHWANAIDGSFTNASDWTGGVVPGIGDDAILDATGGAFTVTSTALENVGGLQLASNATLAVTASAVIVDGATMNAGHILVENGAGGGFQYAVLNTGTIEATGSHSDLEFRGVVNNSAAGAVLAENGASLYFNHDVFGGTISATAGSSIDFVGGGMIGQNGGITLGGDISIDSAGQESTEIDGRIQNTGSIILTFFGQGARLSAGHAILSGGGEIFLGQLGNSTLDGLAGRASSLDNIDNRIIGAGTIGGADPFTLTNEVNGKIESQGPRQLVIDLGADVLRNEGYIRSNGAGGIVLRQTTVDNSGGGRIVAYGGGVHLQGATIISGFFGSSGFSSVVVDAVDGASTLDGRSAAIQLDGGLAVASGATLVLEGTLDDGGFHPNQPLAIGGPQGAGTLTIGADGATLTGGGHVVLAGVNSQLTGAGGGMLTNVSNTISGDGTIGGFGLAIDNQAQGVIEGTTSQVLVLDPGAGTIDNEGLIVARDGSVVIGGAVDNGGRLAAAGGSLTVDGAVTGSGLVIISGGTAAFVGALDERAQFLAGGGVLELFQSQSYTSRVYGFAANGSTTLDLRDIGFTGSGEATFKPQPYGGILSVSDGTHTTQIKLVGDFSGVSFVASSDGQGGVDIVGQPSGAAAVHAFVAAASGVATPPCAASFGGAGARGWTEARSLLVSSHRCAA